MFKVTVAAAARFTCFYYRRGAAAADVQPRWTSLLCLDFLNEKYAVTIVVVYTVHQYLIKAVLYK